MPHPKKFYTDMAGVLIPLAIFAGGLTLATQFIIQCPGSRLEALLQMAAQLFLASPIVLLAVYLFLYRKADTEAGGEFLGYLQHGVVVSQFFTAGFLIAGGFVLLGFALLAAQVGPRTIGYLGLVLLAVVIVVALVSGVIATGLITRWWRSLRNARTRSSRARDGLRDRGVALTPGTLREERELMKKLEKMEPMLTKAAAVFEAEQAARNTIPNPPSIQETRMGVALGRAADTRAETILDHALDRLITPWPIKLMSWVFSIALGAAQLAVVVALLYEGGKLALTACVRQGCTPATTTDGKACASMVACLSSIGINPSPSPFTCAGTSPDGTTNGTIVQVNSTVYCDGSSVVQCISNDTVIIANDSNVVTTLSAAVSVITVA